MHHVYDQHVRRLRSAFLDEVFDEADEDPKPCRCSSVALLILRIAWDTRVNLVSQAITMVFHAPAAVYVQPLGSASGWIPAHLTLQRCETSNREQDNVVWSPHSVSPYRGAFFVHIYVLLVIAAYVPL